MTRTLAALLVLVARFALATDTLYLTWTPGGASTTVSATADQLWCVTVPTPFGVAAVQHGSGIISGACTAGTFAWIVYPDSDTAAALATWSASCTVAGVKTGAVAFRMQDNTPYRWCFCSSTAGSGTVVMTSGVLATLLNAFTPKAGHATNPCVSGVPPVNTGALIPDVAVGLPFEKLE